MTGALQNPARTRAQWKNVAGLHQVLRHCRRVSHDFDRLRPVRRADASGDASRRIDTNLEIRFEHFPILPHRDRSANPDAVRSTQTRSRMFQRSNIHMIAHQMTT